MRTIVLPAFVVLSGTIAIWIVIRSFRRLQAARKARRAYEADVSPQWLNENTYDQDGDEPWK